MKVQKFADLAIKNGYDESRCNGWDWIRENLSLLDDIFQKEKYKKQDGMKSLCMPLIIGKEKLTDLQQKALSTAWYLNNDRERKTKEMNYTIKMLKEGWLKLDENIVKKAYAEKKKLQVSGISECDWLSSKVEEIYKPYVDSKGDCFLMKPKARSRGFSIYRLKNAFCKII